MNKHLTCIECPNGCQLEIEIEKGKALKVTGNTCPKGEVYGRQEIENPKRILTSSVLTEGLSIKMLPTRTSSSIPKEKLFEAMEEIKKIIIKKPVHVGQIIAEDFMGLGIDLIATRSIEG